MKGRYKNARDLPRVLAEELEELLGEKVEALPRFPMDDLQLRIGEHRREYDYYDPASYDGVNVEVVRVPARQPRDFTVSHGVMYDLERRIDENAPPDPTKAGVLMFDQMIVWMLDEKARRRGESPFEREEHEREQVIRTIVREHADMIASMVRRAAA